MSIGKKKGKKEPIKKESFEKPWFKFWPEGVRKHIDYPEIPLSDFLKKTAGKYPDQTAIVYFDREITYRELNLASDKFATALSDLGVKKGDKVALFLPNVPQFIISYYSVIQIGAVETAISPLYKEREVEHQLNDSEAETIVVLDALYPILAKVLAKTKVKRVIVTRLKEFMPSAEAFLGSLLGRIPSHRVERKPNIYFFQELLRKYDANPPKVEINPLEDLVALQYTGGTTGVSKGAMLTHMNLVSNAIMCAEWLRGREGEETYLTVLPLFHIYGMTTSMNAPIYSGGKLIMLPRFDQEGSLKAIEKHKITIFSGAPTMYSMLLSNPNLKKYDLTSLHFCVSGAGPLPPEVQKK